MRSMTRNLFILAALATACGAPEPVRPGRLVDADLAPYPAAYEGILPCADCEGIRYTLNLFDDHVFYLRTAYLGLLPTDVQAFDALGVWSFSPDGAMLVLEGGEEAPMRFSVPDAWSLRMRALDGSTIDSELNYTLYRLPEFVRLEPALTLRGLYQYYADAANFTECRTGRRYPVLFEGDHLALERAYLETPHEPLAPVLAEIEGRLVMAQPMEGSVREMLLVDQFLGLRPGQDCDGALADPPLEYTTWQLEQVGGNPVDLSGLDRKPYLELIASDRHVQGFSGCNSFFGSYALEGENLALGPLSATRRYCQEAARLEQVFMQILSGAAAWRMDGNRLELLDDQGRGLAGFRAVGTAAEDR